MSDDQPFALSSYDYDLPDELIAQTPAARRDESRLLVLDCATDRLEHRGFRDILEYFRPGDLMVVNDTKVFPARLLGRKETGGRVELLILEFPQITSVDGDWQTAKTIGLLKSSKRPKPGMRLQFAEQLAADVEEILPDGKVLLTLRFQGSLEELLALHGKVPLPPYIHREREEQEQGTADRERYQTVFADTIGAVAAPTAGLHFTDALLTEVQAQGVGLARVTLHVGYGTFAPVRVDDIREHRIHAEYVSVPAVTARMVNETKEAGGRVWAVGTTTVRSLEFAAAETGRVRECQGWCDLYMYPGYSFQVVDNLITNFHLPQSSLLFMVSAFAGRERIFAAYEEAVRQKYRFFSYGDAMAIIGRPGRIFG